MNRTDTIQRLLKYIERHLDVDDFDDEEEHPLGFSTYDEFMTFQSQKLNTASLDQLKKWETFSEILRTSRITDNDGIEFDETDGFAFDNQGRVVILI